MATKKKASSTGSRKETKSTDIQTDNGTYKEVMTVALSKNVAGEIKQDAQGQQCAEGDLNAPRWRHPRNFAVEIGGLAIKLSELPPDSVKNIYRYRSIGPKLLVAEIVILIKESVSLSMEKIKAAAMRFVDKAIVQAELPWVGVEDQEHLAEPEKKVVDESVTAFLAAHGGRPMPSDMHVSMEGKVVTKFGGIWRNPRNEGEAGNTDVELEAYFDGRRLRQRIFFVLENSKKGRYVEIHYDDNAFDQELRALRENKEVLLRLKCIEKKIGKKSRLHLDEIEIINAQN